MKQYFLIGIKGKGMQALAKYLSMEGNKVEGYDDNKEKDSVYLELEKYGIIIYENYNINNLSDKEIIVTPAIPKEKLKEVPNFKYYNEFIADITNCNCIIGDGTGFNNKKNDILVLESCEFRKHFLSYQATDVIITNIGLEHTDCYKDFNEIAETFIEFSNKCLGKKIIYGDIEDIDYNKFKGNVYTYGFNNDNDTIIRKTNYIDNTTYILLEYNKTEYSFEIPLRLAKHQILDLVATITYCFSKSYSKEQIKKGLTNISLPKYRYVEEKINGIDTISDFCGHYAGIKNNLEDIKTRYPNKIIKVIFEPISYMRMIQTFNLVCDALKKADYIYVCDITPLRETNIEQYNFSVNNIINALGKAEYWNKKNNLYFNNNDLVVIFGIEGFKTIKNKIKNIEQKQE